MKDRVFVDTNVFVYAILEDTVHAAQREKAVRLIAKPCLLRTCRTINSSKTA